MSTEDEQNAVHKAFAEKRADLLRKLLATHQGIQTLVKAGAPKAQVLEGLAALGWGLEQLAVVEQQLVPVLKHP